MTDKEKQQIMEYQRQGMSHKEISEMLGVPRNTVKSFCRRLKEPTAATEHSAVASGECKHCAAPIVLKKGCRIKLFCSDKCRYAWWGENRNQPYNLIRCARCGKTFSNRGNVSRKYCSHACYIHHRFSGGEPRDKGAV